MSDKAPDTLRTGETSQPACNEVACKHYGRCDQMPSDDCFEPRTSDAHQPDPAAADDVGARR